VATYALECDGTQGHCFTLPEFAECYRAVFGDAAELADLLNGPAGDADKVGSCGLSVS